MNYFELIYECIEKQMILLNFIDFKVHSHVERDIDLAILQALLNAPNSTEINVEQKLEQLNLALEWNRVDIVKSLIMKENRDWIKINLNDLFFKVVIRNQRSFVQLFLNHDFSLNDLFKNTDQLRKLYGNENYILRHNFNDSLQSIYKDIIQPLIETFFEVDAVFYSDGISYNHDRHTDNNIQSEALPVSLPIPTIEPEEDLHFMECSPTPSVSPILSQISSLLSALSLSTPSPSPTPILF
ncbi:unnamed protein product [Rotaria sordida]|nr:unnamed protein product [Rotaria sordida]